MGLNKSLGLVLAVATLTTVAALGGTAYIGRTVETKMTTEAKVTLEKIAPLVRVKAFNYDKSLLGATRTMTLQFGCDDKPLQMTWRDQIKHGPFPGFTGFGAATVDSELLLSDETKAQLKANYGLEVPALKVKSVVALNGDVTSDATLPAISGKLPDGTQLIWQGMTLHSVQTGATVDYEVVVPGFEMRALEKGTSLKLSGAKVKGLTNHGKFWWAKLGSSTGEVSKIEMTAKQGGKEFKMLASHLQSTSSSKLEGEMMSASSEMKGQFEFDKIKLEKVQIASSVKRLHAPTLDAMMTAIFSQNGAALLCSNFADPQTREALQQQVAKQLVNMLQESALKLLAFNPEYSVDKMAASYLGKEGELSYSLGVQGVTADEAKRLKDDPKAVIKKLALAASLKLPVPWIRNIIASAGGNDKAPDDAALAKMIEPMVQQGFVVREGDLLLLKASMKDGKATLNGKEVPVPGM